MRPCPAPHPLALSLPLALLALAGCSTPPLPPTSADALPAIRPGMPVGYLPREQAVDSLALLPPPPATGSPQQAADDAAYRAALAARGSPRWQWAARDAELRFPQAADAFSCALGVPIRAETAPHLTMLMRRTLVDAGLATYRAKDHYKRPRPFVAHDGEMCTPKEDATLRKDGSYPSGHAALGWAWGLVLTQVAPERANPLAQRALDFSASRVACGVHWPSDVAAGRDVAAAVVAQLQANADYRAQLAEARREWAALRAAAAKPTVDCGAEAAALGRR